jgi:hypothetical protein
VRRFTRFQDIGRHGWPGSLLTAFTAVFCGVLAAAPLERGFVSAAFPRHISTFGETSFAKILLISAPADDGLLACRFCR